ncbi:MAG: peptidylprolyl isomerase, partial [Pirellulales bacterium]|nr:peptidylprolyl isomerase [Pirellulales bacterium]
MSSTSSARGESPSSARGSARQRLEVRRTGLEQLETRCVMAAPTLVDLPNVTVKAGVPLNIALDGFDADGNALTFSATSSDTSKLQAIISPQTNRTLEFHISHTSTGEAGDSTYNGILRAQMFEDQAPHTTARIIQLAQSGFYNGVIFHRVLDGFVAQGGDPEGNGTGGSGVTFDDEYNVDLRHSSAGVFSMAKSADDTNDSQFFITLAATRGLDFQHTVFAFTTQQDPSIDFTVPRNANSNNEIAVPKNPITIDSVSVIVDQENGVLRLKAPEGTSGTVTITVFVSDGTGNVIQDSFDVTIEPDNQDDQGFLGPIPNSLHTQINTPVSNTFTFTDVDAAQFPANHTFRVLSVVQGASGLQFGVDPDLDITQNGSTGQFTFTPKNGFVGSKVVGVDLRLGNSTVDRQFFAVTVAPAAPTSIELLTDTGAADNHTAVNNGGVTRLRFRVNGVTPGNEVELFDINNNSLGGVVATGTSVEITVNAGTVLPDGVHQIRARQTRFDSLPLGNIGQIENTGNDATLDVTIDTTQYFTSTPVTTANVDVEYTYDVQSLFEGQAGVVYSLTTAPTGMSINPTTGLIAWTPTASQVNGNPVVVQVVDGANVRTQSFSVGVNGKPTLIVPTGLTAAENTIFKFKLDATDPNLAGGGIGDTLTYGFTFSPPDGVSIDPRTGDITWIVNENQGGQTFQITAFVRDQGGLVDSKQFSVTITEDNQTPFIVDINANNDLSVVRGESVSVTLTGNDFDLPAQGLTFSIDPGPNSSAASLIPAASPQRTAQFTFNSAGLTNGDYTVTVRVTESQGNNPLSGTKQITIHVVPDPAPVIDPIGTQVVVQGETLSFTVAGHDPPPGTQALVYSLEPGAPAGASINASTGLFTFSPGREFQPGSQTITVRVTEQGGAQQFATRDFALTVLEDQPPVITPVADQNVVQGETLVVNVVATDPDPTKRPLVYSLG